MPNSKKLARKIHKYANTKMKVLDGWGVETAKWFPRRHLKQVQEKLKGVPQFSSDNLIRL